MRMKLIMAKLAAILLIDRNIAKRGSIMVGKSFFQITKVLFVVAVTLFVSSQVFAGPMVDGKVGGWTEYANGYYVDYYYDSGAKMATGEIWFTNDTANNKLYLGFVEPLSVVDNSYGQKEKITGGGNIDNSIGWPEKTGRDGEYKPNHKFDELRGSDKAVFKFDGGVEFSVDYIEGFTSIGKKVPPFSSGGVTAGEGSITGAPASSIVAATSLEWNYSEYWDTILFDNFPTGTDDDKKLDYFYSPETEWDGLAIDYSAVGNAYTVKDGAYSDWIFEVAYEVCIDLDQWPDDFDFTGIGSFADSSPFNAHVSPYKLGDRNDHPGTPVEPVPVPGAVLLGMLGLGVAGLKLRKFA